MMLKSSSSWRVACTRGSRRIAWALRATTRTTCAKESPRAFSAGVMIIGALHGRSSLGEDDLPAQRLAARYRERFAAEFGTTCCGILYDQVHAPGGPGSCSSVVERAAPILLELLAEQRSER